MHTYIREQHHRPKLLSLLFPIYKIEKFHGNAHSVSHDDGVAQASSTAFVISTFSVLRACGFNIKLKEFNTLPFSWFCEICVGIATSEILPNSHLSNYDIIG